MALPLDICCLVPGSHAEEDCNIFPGASIQSILDLLRGLSKTSPFNPRPLKFDTYAQTNQEENAARAKSRWCNGRFQGNAHNLAFVVIIPQLVPEQTWLLNSKSNLTPFLEAQWEEGRRQSPRFKGK